jgi:PAS domain S-box-containing protein
LSTDPDRDEGDGGDRDTGAPGTPPEGFDRQLLAASADAVVATDRDGTVRYANPAAATLFGVDPGSLVGRSLTAFVPEGATDGLRDAVAAHLDDRRDAGTEIRVPARRTDGTDLELSLSPFTVGVDGTDYFAATVREVGDRVERERKLEAKNERLTRLASVLSHDLREPLNTARAKLTLARETGDDEYIEEVLTVNRRMAELVDEVLDLTTKGRPVGDTEGVDLGSVVADARSTLDADDLDVSVEGSPTVVADRGRLRALLENLVGNAARHAGPGTSVWVGAIDGGEGFFVADDGPGIPPEDRDAVFEYGHTTSEEGTGLGLSIVRDVASAHGWTARVVESSAGGARFEFEGADVVE